MDLISRQDAIDAVAFGITYVKVFDQETCEVFEPFKQENEALNNAVDRIKELSSADAVEVVRCKDCKHFHYDMPYVIQGIPVLGHEVCDFWGDGCKTNENGFCSYAERRTDAIS